MGNHDHVWGKVERAWLTGTPNRPCTIEGCGYISLDLHDGCDCGWLDCIDCYPSVTDLEWEQDYYLARVNKGISSNPTWERAHVARLAAEIESRAEGV